MTTNANVQGQIDVNLQVVGAPPGFGFGGAAPTAPGAGAPPPPPTPTASARVSPPPPPPPTVTAPAPPTGGTGGQHQQEEKGFWHTTKTLLGLGGILGSVIAIGKSSQIISGTLGGVFQLIGALIDTILAPLAPVIIKGMEALAGFVSWVGRFMQDPAAALREAGEWIKGRIGEVAAIWDKLPDVTGKISASIQEFFTGGKATEMLGKFAGFVTDITPAVVSFFEGLPGTLSTVWADITEAGKAAWNWLNSPETLKILQDIAGNINDMALAAMKAVGQMVWDAWLGYGNFLLALMFTVDWPKVAGNTAVAIYNAVRSLLSPPKGEEAATAKLVGGLGAAGAIGGFGIAGLPGALVIGLIGLGIGWGLDQFRKNVLGPLPPGTVDELREYTGRPHAIPEQQAGFARAVGGLDLFDYKNNSDNVTVNNTFNIQGGGEDEETSRLMWERVARGAALRAAAERVR